MTSTLTNLLLPLGLVVIGLAAAAVGIFVGETDDAPGAALIGILLLLGAVSLALRMAWRRRAAARSGERNA